MSGFLWIIAEYDPLWASPDKPIRFALVQGEKFVPKQLNSPPEGNSSVSWLPWDKSQPVCSHSGEWLRFHIKDPSHNEVYFVTDLLSFATLKLVTKNHRTYFQQEFGTLTEAPPHFLGLFVVELPYLLENSWIYFQCKSYNKRLKIRLFDSYHYTSFIFYESIQSWIFIGISLVVILHNVFLWIATSNSNYATYAAFITIMALIICGNIFANLSGNPISFFITAPFLIPLACYFIQKFSQHLLEAEKYFPRSSSWMGFYAIAFIFSPALSIFFDRSLFWLFTTLGSIPSVLTISVWGIAATRRRQAGALAYSIGWGGFLVSLVIFTADLFLDYEDHAKQFLMAGLCFQMLVLTISIGQKVKFHETLDKIKHIENYNLQNLVRVLCHDLSNPLAVILSNAEYCNTIAASKCPNVWDYISTQSLAMSHFIGQIRFIEAITNNKLKLSIQSLNIHKALDNSLAKLEPDLKKKQITVKKNWKKLPIVNVLSNESRICELILEPMIQNAIKYSYVSGEIEINMHISQDTVSIDIIDFGMGIPELIKENLSEGMLLSTPARGHEIEFGLSLAVAKAALDKTGGKLTVSTHKEKHTRVTITFRKPSYQVANFIM